MNDQEVRDTMRQSIEDWNAATEQQRAEASAKAARRAREVAARRDRITGVTIAQNGTVSYEGCRPSLTGNGRPVTFTVTTYQRRERFDWGSLPGSCPVIDLDGADISVIWNNLICKDHPSFACKIAVCKRVGLRTTNVRQMRVNCEARG